MSILNPRSPFHRLRNEPKAFLVAIPDSNAFAVCPNLLILHVRDLLLLLLLLHLLLLERYILQKRKSARGFEPSTLGVASFCADHQTMPLPLRKRSQGLANSDFWNFSCYKSTASKVFQNYKKFRSVLFIDWKKYENKQAMICSDIDWSSNHGKREECIIIIFFYVWHSQWNTSF